MAKVAVELRCKSRVDFIHLINTFLLLVFSSSNVNT